METRSRWNEWEMKSGTGRHPGTRWSTGINRSDVHIPKENGKTRPLGSQDGGTSWSRMRCAEVLEAVYEQNSLDCSTGFRPGRSTPTRCVHSEGAVDSGRVHLRRLRLRF